MDKSDYKTFIGIDIAKIKFDVAVLLENGKFKHKVFRNDSEGFMALQSWLNDFGNNMLVVMEATNIYHRKLADFLFNEGFSVVVSNPKCMPNFAKSANLRSKTDKVDAKLLAQFAHTYADKLRLYQPKPADEAKLQALVRQLEHLKKQRAAENVRIQMLDDCLCIEITESLIEHYDRIVNDTEQEIKKLVKNNASLQQNMKLLLSIPGIGETTAWMLLAHLGDGSRFQNGKKSATFFGLTPMLKQSGSSLRTVVGISKIGHSDVRKALYAPAMNESLRTLEKRGLCSVCCEIAGKWQSQKGGNRCLDAQNGNYCPSSAEVAKTFRPSPNWISKPPTLIFVLTSKKGVLSLILMVQGLAV